MLVKRLEVVYERGYCLGLVVVEMERSGEIQKKSDLGERNGKT